MLSPGGRLILIKHVLSAILVHILKIMEPPKGIIRKLEKVMADIFWERFDDFNKRHCISWKSISHPTEENGLGIRSLYHTMQAFSCKLWWKFRTSPSLWTRFFASKYGSQEPHPICIQPRRSDSPVWKRMLEPRHMVENNIRMLIHQGNASFWYEDWTGMGAIGRISCIFQVKT